MFTNGPIRQIQIEIPPAEMAALRRDSRKYVRATIREGAAIWQPVGAHLKGSTGSFRSLDDKPALTLNFAKFAPDQRFHGLRKIHLNNSVEDPSYLNEHLGTELFLAAGVPAPRVAWATVELNGRKLGLYVLKEGVTEEFLGLHFKRTDGALHEGGGDVTNGATASLPPQSRDDSDAVASNSVSLNALAAVVAEPNTTQRWTRLEQALDVERFLSFMATEVMIGHRDGYCLARNNYRTYHDPESGRVVFLPHGMDVLFGRADAPIQPRFAGLVATAVMETPEGHRRYRERFGFLLTNVFDVRALAEKSDLWAAQIRPVLNRGEARAFAREVAAVKDRMAARHSSLVKQFNAPELQLLRFENNIATLTNWVAMDEPAGGKLAHSPAPDGKPALHILAGPVTMASWRASVLLAPGQYRFEGAVSLTRVEPLRSGKTQGAGLRIAGQTSPQPHHLTSDPMWRPLQVEFEVPAPGQEKELICELRASRGEAWFALDSLRVIRLK